MPEAVRGSWSQLETRCWIESQRQTVAQPWVTEGPKPPVTHGWATQPRLERSTAGSICSSLSLSPTHLLHTTNINPFENKVWERYFYKEVYSFVHWSSSLMLIMFPLIFIFVLCICMWLYNSLDNAKTSRFFCLVEYIMCITAVS